MACADPAGRAAWRGAVEPGGPLPESIRALDEEEDEQWEQWDLPTSDWDEDDSGCLEEEPEPDAGDFWHEPQDDFPEGW